MLFEKVSAIIEHLQYFIIKGKRKLTEHRKTRDKWYKYIQATRSGVTVYPKCIYRVSHAVW